MGAGMARLEVSFLIDENGMLSVSARELNSGIESAITVKPSYGLTDEQVEKMLLDSYEFAEVDIRERLLREQRVEAERILAALTTALQVDGSLLSSDERRPIDAAKAAVVAAAAGTDHRRIADCITALDLASKDFAQRRMDQGLGRAVSGRAVGEIENNLSKRPQSAHPIE
jgi:molecular chaperone HscA